MPGLRKLSWLHYDARKFTHYLLSPDHPTGRYKARVFASLGFDRSNWPLLKDELTRLTLVRGALPQRETPGGWAIFVRGRIQGVGRRSGEFVIVWLLESPTYRRARFVTAYPGGDPR
ncbi:MAG TPA: hypothetical protein PK413_14390 [Thermoanaerobaculia bacterium]|nr:hypothetical protein [Thermoanaerobaculia bacterium]